MEENKKSFWIDSTLENRKEFPKLEGDKRADVCIIGGGLTGLTTAYYLSKTNLSVVLLEKSKLCEHTSGNTTGKITSQHDLFYDYLLQSEGKEKAKQYYEANEQAISNIEKIIQEEQIDCDFEKQDAYVFTQKSEEIPKIKKEVEAVKEIGGKAEFVENLDLPIATKGAIKFSNQAQFHPVKYAQGLVNSILKTNQVSFYENTKVVDVKQGKEGYDIFVEKGKKVNAKYVVIASHYPIINAPGYYFLKMYQSLSYVIGVETQKELFQGMYINSEKPTISFRTAKIGNNRLLLIGGMDHKTGEDIDLSSSYEKLIAIAKQIDPECNVVYKWCTEDCISLDKIPYIGEFSNLMPNVYVGTGYKKWGMTTSNIAANIIVDKILGKENPYEEVFTSTRLKPIKNYQEMGNMLKEVVDGLVIEKIKIPKETIENLKMGQGKIVEVDGKKVGVYQDENGKLFAVKPVCSHLGCELNWNNLEKTWDCPCHGSRFTYTGKSIYDPSIKDLETVEIE